MPSPHVVRFRLGIFQMTTFIDLMTVSSINAANIIRSSYIITKYLIIIVQMPEHSIMNWELRKKEENFLLICCSFSFSLVFFFFWETNEECSRNANKSIIFQDFVLLEVDWLACSFFILALLVLYSSSLTFRTCSHFDSLFSEFIFVHFFFHRQQRQEFCTLTFSFCFPKQLSLLLLFCFFTRWNF